jgi:hypothetical protein
MSRLRSTDVAKPVGYISYRGADYSANLFIPSDAFALVLQAFTANKYRFVSIHGNKSAYGEVMVRSFMLLESMEEPD